MDYFIARIIFNQLVKISLRQILIDLFVRCELRNIVKIVGWPSAKDHIIEIFCTKLILWHHSPQQMMILNSKRATNNSGFVLRTWR
jgi:hypothetical protein